MSEVGHVYTAIKDILGELGVAKNGVLPGNLGGKPYITAVDLNSEVKKRFVEKDLILIPNETVINYEAQAGTRLTILIVIQGTYIIQSVKDGSSVTISGIGDGVATGSAVSSNIASTNALKNALLRTFLVTEQSSEDSAKGGVPEDPGVVTTSKPKAATAITLKAEIKDAAEARGMAGPDINALGNKISGKSEPKQWAADKAVLEKLLGAIIAGEVA